MTIPLGKTWTREEFLAWAEAQEGRYEFDGLQPVGMTGGTINHGRIVRNLHRALDARLRGGPCEPLGPDAGVQTIGEAIRYPDALVTCSPAAGEARVVPDVVVVFEVVSASTSRTDRILKLREYAAVPSVRRYVILESTSAGLTVMQRERPDEVWRVTTLTGGETLRMPEIGVEIPVTELYENISFAGEGAS